MTWAPDYCTVAELAEFMRIGDELDNTQLQRAVTAASRAVDSATHRQFGQVAVAEARYYRATWDAGRGRWRAGIDDTFVTPTAVDTDPLVDETWSGSAGTAFLMLERNAPTVAQPWTAVELTAAATVYPALPDRLMRVTARWGWSAVPATVVEAALLQGSRYASRRDSPYGIAGSGEQTPGLRLQAKVDPDVEAMLRPYRRIWAVA